MSNKQLAVLVAVILFCCSALGWLVHVEASHIRWNLSDIEYRLKPPGSERQRVEELLRCSGN